MRVPDQRQPAAQAQVVTRLRSGVVAMFASQSETSSDSDPTGIVWGLSAGSGQYLAGFIIPSLPPPGIVPAPGNPFAGDGVLSLTGFAWVAGDPFQFTIGVPEIDAGGLGTAMAPVVCCLGFLERRRPTSA